MSAPAIAHGVNAVYETTQAHFGGFIDTKSGDVSGTLKNYGNCFQAFAEPSILTISAIIATQGFMEIRKALPNTQIALFSVPTDMSREECIRHHDMPPAEKITKDINFFMTEWDSVCEEEGVEKKGIFAKPFDLVVAAPGDLQYLNAQQFDRFFSWVTPNIRDEWMDDDHQDAQRGMGVYEALAHGARWIVMGTQLLKGNPAGGITAEESQRRTLAEIQRFKKDFKIE